MRGSDHATREALDGVLARGRTLVDSIRALGAGDVADAAQVQLAGIHQRRDLPGQADWSALYLEARWILRELALQNPLLDFDELLFVRRHWPRVGHQCAHHVGESQEPGAELCVLTGLSPGGSVRAILGEQLAPGGIGRPDLSYDGERIVFPYAPPRPEPTAYVTGQPGARSGACLDYDIYEVGVDGGGLVQLTTDDAEDTEPCFLPNGRVAFSSSRGDRFVQCGDWALVFSLYSMAADGSDKRRITHAKEGEWYPSVLDDGRIIYMRWEYVMKAYNTIQYLWTVYPDGSRAQLAFGEHFQFSRGPLTFIEPRQIPGTDKVIATGAAHHNSGVGPLCIVDLARNRDASGGMLRITPEVGYPEATDDRAQSPTGWYSSPWPLSEDYFLVAHSFDSAHNSSEGYALYLLDTAGNMELIYRDAELSCYSPIPLRPRSRPGHVPQLTGPAGEGEAGTILMTDVYEGLAGVERGTVKHLRVLETLPKLEHTSPQRCDVGVASGWDPRMVLGTVPVEEDGSAWFNVPADRLIFFEALDEDYLEVRRMRSYTNVLPGEHVSCIGCHESSAQAPHGRRPRALDRPPVEITPPPFGVRPMDFAELVQPLLDNQCIRCHDAKAEDTFDLTGDVMVPAPVWRDHDQGPQHNVSKSFLNLLEHVSYVRLSGYDGGNLPLPAYATGSHESSLMRILADGHHGVELGLDEWRLLAAWIDCNAPFLGSYDRIDITPPPPQPLSPAPYEPEVTEARRKELQSAAPEGQRLCVHLDCGAEVRVPAEAGQAVGVPSLRMVRGSAYHWSDSAQAAAAHFGSIVFDGETVTFVAEGLEPDKRYRLGFSWWDYDSSRRAQSVSLERTTDGERKLVLDAVQLPSYLTEHEEPAQHELAVPAGFYPDGRLQISFEREAGANVVVSEIWLLEDDR